MRLDWLVQELYFTFVDSTYFYGTGPLFSGHGYQWLQQYGTIIFSSWKTHNVKVWDHWFVFDGTIDFKCTIPLLFKWRYTCIGNSEPMCSGCEFFDLFMCGPNVINRLLAARYTVRDLLFSIFYTADILGLDMSKQEWVKVLCPVSLPYRDRYRRRRRLQRRN